MARKNSRSKIQKRRDEILELLKREGKIYIADISKRFDISLVTARSDLDALAEENKLVRMTGGAILSGNQRETQAFTVTCYAQKKEIAETCASLIQDGSTIFINAGTTTALVAKELKSKRNLSVVTNSVDVAISLGEQPSFRVILLGGSINSQHGFTYGADTQEHLNRFSADFAVLSVDGVSESGEISTCHAEEAIIDRIMVERSKKVLIVADSSKIGRAGFSYVCRCNEKIKIITNKK